jgi:hypothetical protein
MNYSSLHSGSFRQDSIKHQSPIDTAIRISPENNIKVNVPDTQSSHYQQHAIKDSIGSTALQKLQVKKLVTDTIQEIRTPVYNPYKKSFNIAENFLVNNSLNQIRYQTHGVSFNDSSMIRAAVTSPVTSEKIHLQDRIANTESWPMLIFIFVVLLFIWIKIFYNKFFSFLANSLSSYQLSAKVFREKNVLLKRVSFVLDVIYIIILSVFLYESFTFLNLSPVKMTSYNLFLLFLNILILFTLARSMALKLFGYLFRTESLVSEFVHNNFIINKGIGIVLFPIVFAICYAQENLIGILLIAGLIILGTGVIFKIIRGYQIIIRKEVLFFYLILYLCTLEILPLLIGYKVFMSLL